jgi:hypothetical protein
VAVEASQTETDFLISLAKEYTFINGVVGWIDLQTEDVVEKLLRYNQFPVAKGFGMCCKANHNETSCCSHDSKELLLTYNNNIYYKISGMITAAD